MKILLDTHAALWWWMNHDSLGAKARAAMSDPEVTIFFSAASAYEISQKNRLSKLELPPDLQGENLIPAVVQEGWQLLPLSPDSAVQAAGLINSHRDPFDRMLWAQAEICNLTLASRDPFFKSLQIDLIW